jgi:tRNA (mo5U34)-methyltransferase
MEQDPYNALRGFCRELGFDNGWTEAVCTESNSRLVNCNHGDFPAWRAALEGLPPTLPVIDLDQAAPRFGDCPESRDTIRNQLMALHPWRKGPLNIAGVEIDTEWRSDWKWSRVAPHVELRGNKVLDIGCGNGYYGWRMLGAGADLVIGIDPTWVYVMQWLACRHFAGNQPNFVLPLAIEDLPALPVAFDSVFSMGVLYHRRDPTRHLSRLHDLLRPAGTLVLETLVLPDSQASEELSPTGRYARMRNVWAIPGCERLTERLTAWVNSAGFAAVKIVHLGETTPEEQRSTEWMTFESLAQSLDPTDGSQTLEGYPAPRRAVLIARKD